MKRLISVLFLSLLIVATASARTGQMPVTHLGGKFMSVLDIDTVKPAGPQSYTAWANIYFPRSVEPMGPGVYGDWMGVRAEYDCTTPGKWRATHLHLYALDQPEEPVYSDEQIQAWSVGGEGTPPMANWRGVCKREFDASQRQYPVEYASRDVLIGYRAFVRQQNGTP